MRFHFPENCYLTVADNVAHRGESFVVEKDEGNIIINVLAENTGEDFTEPLFAVIRVKNNTPSVFGNLRLLCWGNDADVSYALCKRPFFSPPTALAQTQHKAGAEVFTATVYRDSRIRLLLETTGKTASFDLPEISNPEIRFQSTPLGFLCAITAKCNKGEYLLLILYDGKFNKIFEMQAENVVYSPHAFTATEFLADMLGRRRVSSYSFSGATLNKPVVTFTYAEEKKYPPELTPYLFLEALRAGDINKARTYVSADLAEDIDALTEFFGSFTEILCPRYKNYAKKSDLLSVALLYESSSPVTYPKIFKFVTEKNVITNIEN